jgi:hypothetical protein
VTEPTEVYVYGVVPAGSEVPPGPGVGPGGPLRLIEDRDVAALISDVPAGPLEAGRQDLERHGERLREAMASATVLPMRFGMVMPDEARVRAELLEPHCSRLVGLLAALRGRVELRLRATYEEGAILREVLAADPRAAKLRQEVQGKSEAATYYERIRLGEVVVEGVAAARERDTANMLDALRPLADDVRVGEPPHERTVFAASFLVAEEAIGRFDDAVSALGAAQGERMRFAYTGPLPPHSFVELDAEAPAWA